MGRTTKNKTLDSTESGFNENRLAEAEQATQELAHLNTEAQANTRALAEQLGYNGSLSADTLEEGIRDSRARINLELFTIGARLLLLKEQCLHGEFMVRCERLGYESRFARRLMQATLKFSNRATSPVFEQLGKSKLFELVVLDDEEIMALENGESARGITFDDIDRMPVSELRKALRDREADNEVIRKRGGAREAEIEKLTKELSKAKKRIETATPDEIGAQLREEVDLFTFEAEATILGKLTPGFEALAAHAQENGCTHEEYMAGCLCQIERALIGLRSRFNVKAKPDGDERPEWTRPGAFEKAAEQIKKNSPGVGHA